MKKLVVLLSIFFSFNVVYCADFVGRFGASSATTDKGKIFNTDFRDFDVSVSFQPGVFWGHNDLLSTAFLFDIGFNDDKYEIRHNIDGKRVLENFNFKSLSVGLFPRLNVGFISIGLGGGIKLPLNLKYSREGNKHSYDFGDIRDSFKTIYIPYVKASADFLIKNNKRMITLGVYANYDFPMDIDKNGLLKDVSITKGSLASFDIGFQIGMYFIN